MQLVKILFAFFGLVLASNSYADNGSYLEACVFEAEVRAEVEVAKLNASASVTPRALLVELKKVLEDKDLKS